VCIVFDRFVPGVECAAVAGGVFYDDMFCAV